MAETSLNQKVSKDQLLPSSPSPFSKKLYSYLSDEILNPLTQPRACGTCGRKYKS